MNKFYGVLFQRNSGKIVKTLEGMSSLLVGKNINDICEGLLDALNE